MIQVYGIKNCDSVKKALSFFKNNDLEYDLFDFKEKNVKKETIESWLKQVDLKKLFNSRSTTYRTLKLKEIDPNDDEKIERLHKENLLIKRPVVEFNGKVLVGFNEKDYKETFL